MGCALLLGCALPPPISGSATGPEPGTVARSGSEANDPVARGFVSDRSVAQGHALFRAVMTREGMIGVRSVMRACERPDRVEDPSTPNLPAGDCMAFDRAQWMLGLSMESQRGIRMLPGLGPEDVQRREANYLRVLRVPPAQHRLVSDSVFQRVFALSMGGR